MVVDSGWVFALYLYLHGICICIVFCGVCSAWWWTQGGWGDYPILISSPASTPPPTNAIIIIIPIPIIITIIVIIITIRVIAQECVYFFLQLARAAAAIFLAGYRGWVYGYHVCSAVSLLGIQRVVKLEEGLEGCCESGLGRV